MNHIRAILAVARKDALDIVLDKAKIAGLLSPLALTLLWLLINILLSGHTTAILVYDPGQSHLEQVVQSAFASSRVTQASSPSSLSSQPSSSRSRNTSAAIRSCRSSEFCRHITLPMESTTRSNNQGTVGGNALDSSVMLGSTIIMLMLMLTLWVLRRQASVAAAI